MKASNTFAEEQIFKYMRCPLQYYLEVNENIKPPVGNKTTMKESLDFIANTFCRKLYDGEVLTISKLKKLWDKECSKNEFDMKICVAGWGKLMSMYNWAKKIQLRILDIAVPYQVILQDSVYMSVTGVIPMIGLTTDNEPMLLIWHWDDRKVTQGQIDMNLKYTIWCYAFYSLTEKSIGILVHNIKHNEDIFSFRGKDDYKRLIKSFSMIGKSILSEIWYPREGPLCTNCYLLGACRSWKGE